MKIRILCALRSTLMGKRTQFVLRASPNQQIVVLCASLESRLHLLTNNLLQAVKSYPYIVNIQILLGKSVSIKNLKLLN